MKKHYKMVALLTVCAMTSSAQAQSWQDMVKGAVKDAAKGAMQQRQQQQQSPNNGRSSAPPQDVSVAGSAVGGCVLGGALAWLATKDKKEGQRNTAIAGGCVGGTVVAVAIAKLTNRDRAALRARSAELFNEDSAVSEAWVAPDSKARVTIVTTEPVEKQADIPFTLDEAVEAPEAGTRIEATTYVVNARRLNFRSAPTTADPRNVIGYFDNGANVEVIGRTPDGKWALVGDEGVVVGYAAFSDRGSALLVTPEEARAKAPANRLAPVQPAMAKPKITNSLSTAGSVRVAEASRVKTVTVLASTQCKAATATSGKATESYLGCAQTDGKYRMMG
jgi:hypothetical protein